MRRAGGLSSWGIGVAILLSAVPAAFGQSRRIVRGTVLDMRDHPVAAVAVVAAGARTTVTDDSGRFSLEIEHRDRVVVDLRRVGFMPSRMGLGPGGDTAVSILLLPSAQRLPGIEVRRVVRRAPTLAGFEERMRERKRGAGTGHFITVDQIEAAHAQRATQIVENVPSIIVRRLSGERFAIFGRTTSGAECPATVYLDGVRLGGSGEPLLDRRGNVVSKREAGPPIDQYVLPSEIAGVEVYARGIFAPSQFQPLADPNAIRCAIVVYWTKHAS